MAELFTAQLSDVDIQTPVMKAPVDRSKGANSRQAATIIKGGMALRDDAIKSEFQEDVKQIEEKETIFTQKKQELEGQLLSSKDAAIRDNIHKQLINLELNAESGRLSPREAAMRRSTILKSAINDYPWLAADFRSFAAGRQPKGLASTESPENKELDKMRQDAVRANVPLSRIFERGQQKFEADEAADEVKFKAAQGTLDFAVTRSAINKRARAMRSALMSNALTMLRENPTGIDETDWALHLGEARSTLRATAIDYQAEMSKAGKLLTKAQEDTLMKDIENELTELKHFIEQKDKLNYLERRRQEVTDQGFLTLAEMLPFTAGLLANGAGEFAFKFGYDIYPKMVARMKSHGGIAGIQQLADNGNWEAGLFLAAMKMDKSLIAKGAVGAIQRGGRANSPIEEMMANATSAEVLSQVNTEGNDYVSRLQRDAHLKLLQSGNVKELKHYLNNSIYRNVIKDGDMKNVFGRYLDSWDVSLIKDIPATIKEVDSPPIKFDQKKDQFVIERKEKGPLDVLPKTELFGGLVTFGGDPSVSVPLDDINLIYKLRKKYQLFGDSKDIFFWVDDMVNRINQKPETTDGE